MKTTIKNLVLGIMFVFMIASPVITVAAPLSASAKTVAECEKSVLGIPPWYRGLVDPSKSDCSLISPDPNTPNGISLNTYIWRIVLNGVDIALVLVAYLTVFFILYGGFLYMTGGALPGQLEKARKTIINAVVGLVICMGGIALTNLVFSIIK